MNLAVTVLVSFLAGGAASILAPWAQWHVDKRRADRDRRKAAIAQWRGDVHDHFADDRDIGPAIDLSDGQRYRLIRTSWYDSLRDHLTPAIRADLERPGTDRAGHHTTTVELGRMRHPMHDRLLAEIARIAKEWKVD